MRPVLTLVLSWVFLLSLPACRKKDSHEPDAPSPPTPNVYVFGTEGNDALIWKNDTATKVNGLPVPGNDFKSSSLAVSNGKVYIAGGRYYYNGSIQAGKPMYWLNGIANTLPDSSGNAFGNAIFVSGTDVYVGGFTYYKDTSHVPYSSPAADYPLTGMRATVWKNGMPVSLPGFGVLGMVDSGRYVTRGYVDYVNSIYVSGTDVYVSGGSYYVPAHAAYWKNGARIDLTVSSDLPTTTSLFVSGSDVYVSGFKSTGLNSTAIYWKNGIAQDLGTNSFGNSGANSVFVSDSDVYIAGWQVINGYRRAIVWKNGIAAALTSGPTSSSANSVYVSGSDVYVAGCQWVAPYGNYTAVYWKNGIPDTLTDGSVGATALSIKVE
jgi:hypothetical protein